MRQRVIEERYRWEPPLLKKQIATAREASGQAYVDFNASVHWAAQAEANAATIRYTAVPDGESGKAEVVNNTVIGTLIYLPNPISNIWITIISSGRRY